MRLDFFPLQFTDKLKKLSQVSRSRLRMQVVFPRVLTPKKDQEQTPEALVFVVAVWQRVRRLGQSDGDQPTATAVEESSRRHRQEDFNLPSLSSLKV